jgi:pimeloyl-ACP methyl ester carboxylesterase
MTQNAAAPAVKNVLLVHGAFANAASWNKVIPQLQAKGLNVIAVSLPLTGFADDLAAARRALATLEGPALLVGHSYGGAVITEVGSDPKVAGLVYVAAFAPDDGQVLGDLGKEFTPAPGLAELKPQADGFLLLGPKGVVEDFAPDLPVEEKQVMIATQPFTSGAIFGAKVSSAAWHKKPTWYVVAGNDRMIPPDLERSFAKQMGATMTVISGSSHVAMLSHPKEVAGVIERAASGAK